VKEPRSVLVNISTSIGSKVPRVSSNYKGAQVFPESSAILYLQGFNVANKLSSESTGYELHICKPWNPEISIYPDSSVTIIE
jgi:hypothetical protein